MAGLDKILQEIADAAEGEAKAILAEAGKKAEASDAKLKAESDAKVAAIQREAEKSVADIGRAGDSAVQLQQRQRTLQVKQELIEETLSDALAAMRALPDSEYFDLLLRLAAANAMVGEGLMLLDEKDRKRLPKDFEKKLAGALPAGAKLTVAEAKGDLDGGFVLKYGDIEQNCSFAAIVDARREEFSDAAREVLFS